ncbi:MAG: EAL domain-containing protein [Actinomycetota bacterium]
MNPVRVLLIDDDELVRRAFGALIERADDLELAAAAPNPHEGGVLAAQHKPDVAVVDVKMPGGGGPAACREVLGASPGTKVIALSAYEDRATVLEMVSAGAIGYHVKGDPPHRLVEAIREAALGRGSLSGRVTGGLIEELATKLREGSSRSEVRREQRLRIEQILAGDHIRAVFQPIVDLSTLEVVGAEGLSRFDLEPLRSPDVWFAEALSVGLGSELEVLAARTVVMQSAGLPEGVFVSVNVSPKTLIVHGADDLFALAAGRSLVIEVTEHAPVRDYEDMGRACEGIRALGGRLAVDDAGAGFASLRHILMLHPEIIKIDISLTRHIDQDKQKRALAAALITFAREAGYDVVAEGVENDGELETLRELGVAYGQGRMWGLPGYATEFDRTVRGVAS